MTALDDIADVQRPSMRDAARQLGFETSGARLVSASSRLIWHLPKDQVALTITRPGSKTADDIQAEVAAVRSATASGVHTPSLFAQPAELSGSRFALPYHWIFGRPFRSEDWPVVLAEVAKLARSQTAGLPQLSLPVSWPDPAWVAVLGQQLYADLSGRIAHVTQKLRNLLGKNNLVLCHGDLHPSNFLVTEAGDPWIIDLEHSRLAPPEWDAAKLIILSSRFGEPTPSDSLKHSWEQLDGDSLRRCVSIQETQIVAWLLEMTLGGRPDAATECRLRAASLSDGRRWHHLPSQ